MGAPRLDKAAYRHFVCRQENGETLLTGRITDQSALHGLLNRLQNIGIALIAVNPVNEVHIQDDEGKAET